MSDERAQWYTNKELFEMMQALSGELQRTTQLVRQYNGLREEVGALRDELHGMQAKSAGRQSVGQAVVMWGGWAFGLTGAIAALAALFGGVHH